MPDSDSVSSASEFCHASGTSMAMSLTLTNNMDLDPVLREKSRFRRLYDSFYHELVMDFNPALFASVMGTGVSGVILYTFTFPAKWLQVCGCIMSVIALALFLVLMAIFIFALYCDHKLWSRIHRDPAYAPAMGCMVMGYNTLVNMLHALTEKSWIYAVWVLWWIAVAASVYTSFITFFVCLVSKHRKHANYMDASSINLTFLLPVVTLMVAAASGGIITPDLPHLNMQITTTVVSFIMWAIAVTQAFIVVAVNFWRLFVHKIPATGQVFTMFLPVGFLGQGSYAVLLFGRNCALLILDHSADVASSSYTSFLHSTAELAHVDVSGLPLVLATAMLTVASVLAMTLMAFGYFFTFLAFASTMSKMAPFARKPNTSRLYYNENGNVVQRAFSGLIRFNKGFWSMSFPLGTMSLSNTEMYNLYNGLAAFRYIGIIYTVFVVAVSIGCLIGIVYKVVKQVVEVFGAEPKAAEPKETV